MKNNKAFAIVLLIFGILGWSCLYLFIRLLPEINSANISLFRFVFAFLVIIPFYFLAKNKKKIKLFSKDFFFISILCLLNGALVTTLIVLATKNSTASISSILVNTNPLFIGLLAPFLIKEKNKTINYLGFFLAFLGVLLIVTEGGNFTQLLNSKYFHGYLYGLSASLAVSFSTIYLKRYIAKYSIWTITFYSFFLSALFLGFLNIFIGDYKQLVSLAIMDWIWLFLIGAFCTALSFIAFFNSIKVLGASKASVFKLLISFFSVILALLFLKEVLTWYIIVGGFIIIIGLYLVQKK